MTEEEDEPLVPGTALEHWVADTKARLYRTAKGGPMNEHPMSIEIRRLEAEIERQKSLITRAADALESNQMSTSTSCEIFTLIDELRKAALTA